MEPAERVIDILKEALFSYDRVFKNYFLHERGKRM